MRLLLLFLALHVTLFSAQSVEKKIFTNQKNLKSKSKVERSINRKLKDVAKDIQNEEKKLSNIKLQIENLGRNIARSENVVKDKEVNLTHLASQNMKLIKNKRDIFELRGNLTPAALKFLEWYEKWDRDNRNVCPLEKYPSKKERLIQAWRVAPCSKLVSTIRSVWKS